MPGGRPFPRLLKVHQLFVFHAFFQDVPRCIPDAILYFAEIPGVTFSAGKIAPGLIYGKIVFRSGEVNRGDQTVYIPIFIFKCRLTGRLILSIYLDQTASGRKTLFLELTF
jgi:hypothetical protein